MAVLHKVKAYLYHNLLAKDKCEDYIARTVSERSLNVKQICEAAINRGGAEVSATAMAHTAELFLKEMAYQLCDGYSINTGYFTASPTIRGLFDSPTERFDHQKHKLLFRFAQGEQLRAEIPNIEVDILGIAETDAQILRVTDVKSGSINNRLTPGRNLKIIGQKIKIVGDSPANGVYFTNLASGERISVPIEDVVTNNPSELLVIIPELAAGTYHIALATQYAVGHILKEPRKATLDRELIVEG